MEFFSALSPLVNKIVSSIIGGQKMPAFGVKNRCKTRNLNCLIIASFVFSAFVTTNSRVVAGQNASHCFPVLPAYTSRPHFLHCIISDCAISPEILRSHLDKLARKSRAGGEFLSPSRPEFVRCYTQLASATVSGNVQGLP